MISSNSSSTSLNVETRIDSQESISSHGKKPLKEGSVQLTSLSTLLSHHRYFFLYHDTLIVSKLKGACSYKLKEKLRLERVWIASSNTVDSFLIGWPFTNYLVHFRSAEEKEEWFELLSCCVQQCMRPLWTTISMDINVRGRKQTIRRRVENGKKSGEIVVDTACDLGLPHTSYQLTLTVGDGSGRSLQGPENVYVVVMSEIERQGLRLSESQKKSLDTCPIANARLTLSTIKSNSGPSARQIVNSIKKKVLARGDGRSIFGKELTGPTPPQPIMTVVDHLRMDGFDSEGIFRKSPKQSTFKELKSELDKGLVPDFHKYNTHVLASILKEYLRSIPGKILLSGNYELWMREVADEPDLEKKISSCRSLLSHLPTSHSILLANVLKLLNKISNSETSKMTASSLSVCLAPSFLESPDSDPMEGGKKIPPLIEFLITHAVQVVPGFSTDNVFSIMKTVDHNANMVCSPTPSSSHSDDGSQKTPIIEEIMDECASQSSLAESELPEEPRSSTHLETISEMTEPLGDERLSFSDSEDSDDEEILRRHPNFRSFSSRTSFVSETLRSSTEEMERTTPVVSTKIEKTDTPRSPCLKRIHFQRTEAQHRNKEASTLEALKLHRPGRKNSLEEVARKNSAESILSSRLDDFSSATPSRKESREEATQTSDCGLPSISERFPAFRSNAALIEEASSSPKNGSPPVPADPAPTVFFENDVPKVEHVLNKDNLVMEKDFRPCYRNEEQQTMPTKPTVQVAPFSQEPSLKTINERLASLRLNCLQDRAESQRNQRKSYIPPEPYYSAPNVSRGLPTSSSFEPSESPSLTRRFRRDDVARSLTNSPIMARSTPVSNDYQIPYQHLQEETIRRGNRKVELQRSSSHRGAAPFSQARDVHRASSVKAGRRFERATDACVGMDPLEINWSVRKLKTLFQDTKAPAIDTDYTLA
ncbi:unnamed protein product [Caenorhabditis auriculariae]|uniref:Rho-GAP domain-containing protein n=1 Tax=Caenorhabditis auriculariae TaxID=2777116 RepID=A0A8S1GZ51_9PELO|nr:unnamed protein product [Caenorhabditis auriculariae]